MGDWGDRQHPDTLCLFDVDGTLTPARRPVTQEVLTILQKLKKVCVFGFVGGSDLVKQEEQLGKDCTSFFDYAFAENGLTAYRQNKPLPSQNFIGYLGEEKYAKLANFVLRYIADLDIPIKRGTFIEFRNGMINISPIGRNCSLQERDAFEVFDKEHKIRSTFVDVLKKEFADYNLTYSIGGQISFDVFPVGWDKTFCLRHIKTDQFKQVHFFGDKTFKGGNDYEIYSHPDVQGHAVQSPSDTIQALKELFPALRE